MSQTGTDLAPLKGGALAVAAIALALGTFMQVLDGSIANVSIPTIAGNLGVSADQGTWVITSFAVSNGISVPVSAFLMTRFGVVRTFLISVVLFTLASLLCGLSWSLGSLVFFRVIQGAVSGPMIPGSQALLISIFAPTKRGTALAIWSMTTLIAPICGPIFGGYISDNFTWPWIFLINLPVGMVCAAICWRMLASRETPTRKVPIDRIGFALLVVWVGALQIMLDKGKDSDWFNSTAITALAIISAVGFVAWVIWEVTDANPIVDLSLFGSRNFAIGTLVFCLGYGLLFGNLVLLPLWLQTQQGYTATWAGLVAAAARRRRIEAGNVLPLGHGILAAQRAAVIVSDRDAGRRNAVARNSRPCPRLKPPNRCHPAPILNSWARRRPSLNCCVRSPAAGCRMPG